MNKLEGDGVTWQKETRRNERKKVTEWRDRATWPNKTRRNAMASCTQLLIFQGHTLLCLHTPRERGRAERGRKLMRKRARKHIQLQESRFWADNFLGWHTPGEHHSRYECRTWLEEPAGEEPEQASASEDRVSQLYNSGTCKWSLGEDQFVIEEWILKVKAFPFLH